MKLFSDKALISLYNMTHSTKPANKEYRKLREKIKQYPLSGKEPNGGIYANTRIVPYDIIEEFMNCPDFLEGGMSVFKLSPKEDGTERRIYRVSVLPAGNTKRTYYRFIVEGFDERMIDKSVLEED